MALNIFVCALPVFSDFILVILQKHKGKLFFLNGMQLILFFSQILFFIQDLEMFKKVFMHTHVPKCFQQNSIIRNYFYYLFFMLLTIFFSQLQSKMCSCITRLCNNVMQPDGCIHFFYTVYEYIFNFL